MRLHKQIFWRLYWPITLADRVLSAALVFTFGGLLLVLRVELWGPLPPEGAAVVLFGGAGVSVTWYLYHGWRLSVVRLAEARKAGDTLRGTE